MGDAEDRKRKASEIDATAVAPKKKMAAQAALAAAAEKDSAGSAKAGGSTSVGIKLEPGAKPSYSVEVTAPSGALAGDSEEVLKFQNERLYAALEAKKYEVKRLQMSLDKYELTDAQQRETIGCITRHWYALTEELKGTWQRLEHCPASIDTSRHAKFLQSLSTLKGLIPAEVDPAMEKSCQVAQELMREVVQSVMDNNVQLKAIMKKFEGAAGDEELKREVAKANKRLDDMVKDLDKMQDTHREFVVEEGSKADEVRERAARATHLEEQVEFLTRQTEQAERRLVLSEQNVRSAREFGPTNGATSSGGADGSGDSAQQRNVEHKQVSESRLEEIKTLQKKILQMTEQNGASSHAPQDGNETLITQSPAYVQLSEQLKAVKKECDTYHTTKITHLNMELVQERERNQQERIVIENQHNLRNTSVVNQLQVERNKVLEAKQEVRSLQFKLDQKSVGEISTKRAEELNETLQKVQAEYTRLRKEHEALKARPDAEELRREFREEKDKLWKERDIELNKATDLAEQLKEKDKKIDTLMAASKGDGANGVNGADSALHKEVASLKKEVEGLRQERRDMTRRLQKADRGFNDCNKLYQQYKKDKEEAMKDLESLGLSFEEMQEQNTRILQTMKQKDEDHNELLRQRIKERQEREMLAEEKNALKLKLDKSEELLKAREDAIERFKKDLENVQFEQAKRLKEDECSSAIVSEHRKMLTICQTQAKDARRDAEKARGSMGDLQKSKQDTEKELHEIKFEQNRLQEEFESAQRRLTQMERAGASSGSGGTTMEPMKEDLLKHYRSCVRCHCNDERAIKERVLPCGHASCKKCIEKLVKDRSRKCPQCSTRFDQNDVKPLHLQSSFGDAE